MITCQLNRRFNDRELPVCYSNTKVTSKFPDCKSARLCPEDRDTHGFLFFFGVTFLKEHYVIPSIERNSRPCFVGGKNNLLGSAVHWGEYYLDQKPRPQSYIRSLSRRRLRERKRSNDLYKLYLNSERSCSCNGSRA